MKVVPERLTVLADRANEELTVLMEGFRLTLTGAEARWLCGVLDDGVRRLYPLEPPPRREVHEPIAVAPVEKQRERELTAAAAAFRPLVETLRRRRQTRRAGEPAR